MKRVNTKVTRKRATRVESRESNGEKSRLAKYLGISRQLLNHYLKDPLAPKLDDKPGWVDYQATHGRAGSDPPDIKRKIAEKRLELITAQTAKANRENEEAAGKLIRDEDNQKSQQFAVRTFSDEIRRLVKDAPSLLVGLTEIEIRQKLQEFEATILPIVQEAFLNYENSKTN